MKTKHDLLYVRHSASNAARRQIWEEIATDINRLGPPVKDAKCWKQCWNSFQTGIKNKLKFHREKQVAQRQACALQYPNTLNHDDQEIIGITGMTVSRYDLLPSKKSIAPVVLNHSLPPVVRTYTRLRARVTHTEAKTSEQATSLTVQTSCQTSSTLAADSSQDQTKNKVVDRPSSCNTEPNIPLVPQNIQPPDITLPSVNKTPVNPTAISSDLGVQNNVQPRRGRRFVSLKLLNISYFQNINQLLIIKITIVFCTVNKNSTTNAYAQEFAEYIKNSSANG